MIPTIQLLQLENTSIYQQLEIEEALLRSDSGNWCITNKGSTPAIVLGISGKLDQLVDYEVWEANPLPLIRRFSGGGTVVVDHNTLFTTMICNEEEASVAALPEPVMQYNGSLYAPLLEKEGFSVREHDFVIGQHKIAGNAQYIRKGRWLHHTSWLWDYEEQMMRYLQQPKRQPSYRDGRDHGQFLQRLSEYLDSPEQLLRQLRASLEKKYLVQEVGMDTVSQWLAAPHRKSLREIEYVTAEENLSAR